VQGHTFLSDAKILDLQCYDMILGEDWLESCSPMWIHWDRKIMRFNHKGTRITLKGVTDDTSRCPAVSSTKLQGLLKHGAVAFCLQLVHTEPDNIPMLDDHICSMDTTEAAIPQPIQQLIDANADLFAEPSSLPPRRDADHHIPLLPGAQPVNVRPYRYSPAQKSEIENQVKEMFRMA